MPKKNEKSNEEEGSGSQEAEAKVLGSTNELTEKKRLEFLYSEMKVFGINSISDVEVKISRL